MGKPGIPERSVSRIMSDHLLSDVMISLRYQYASMGRKVPGSWTDSGSSG